MKVHIRQIPEGGTLHLEGEQDSSSLGLEEAGAALLAGCDQGLTKQLSDFLDTLSADIVKITLLSEAAAKVANGAGAYEVLAVMVA